MTHAQTAPLIVSGLGGMPCGCRRETGRSKNNSAPVGGGSRGRVSAALEAAAAGFPGGVPGWLRVPGGLEGRSARGPRDARFVGPCLYVCQTRPRHVRLRVSTSAAALLQIRDHDQRLVLNYPVGVVDNDQDQGLQTFKHVIY